jgi:hypothetical protein
VRAAQLAHPHVQRHLAALEARALLGARAGAVALLAAAGRLAGARALAAPDALARLARAGGGLEVVQADRLLVEALTDPLELVTLESSAVRPAQRVADLLAAARKAAAAPEATAETVLWEVWSRTGLAERWERASLEGGPAGEADGGAANGTTEAAEEAPAS